MNVAKYNKRITFQRKEKIQDDEGNWVTEWVDKVTVWAHINGLRGKEYLEAGANAVKVSTRIYIRYRKGITNDMRIKSKNIDEDGQDVFRYFEVVNANNIDELNIEYEIHANEVKLDG